MFLLLLCLSFSVRHSAAAFAFHSGKAKNSLGVQDLGRGAPVEKQQHRQATLAEYQHLRDGSCAWSSEQGDASYFYWPSTEAFRKDYWNNLFSWAFMTSGVELHERYNWFQEGWVGRQDVQSHLCIVEQEPASHNTTSSTEWRIRRVGPFVGTGGGDWHRLQVPDAFGLEDEESYAAVTAQYLAPIDAATGHVLPYPPIHVHHANLNVRHVSTNFSRLGQWHGDSQCTEKEGGMDCFMRVLPSTEYDGYPLLEAGGDTAILDLDADINDVRPTSSEELVFYVEAAVRITRATEAPSRTKKSTGVVILGTPARSYWWRTSDFAGTYFVPATQQSALWCTARLPVSGEFVADSSHVYTHQDAGFAGVWVIAGAVPEDLGLMSSSKYSMRKPWEPWTAQSNTEMLEFQTYLQTKLQLLQDRCDVAAACPRLVWQWNATKMENGFPRQLSWPDEPWSFTQGDVYTMIVFHAPSDHHHGEDLVEMHFALHGTYVPANATPEFHYVLPSLTPDAAWLDAPNAWMLLTRMGGPPVWNWKTELKVDVAVMILAAAVLLFILLLGRALTRWLRSGVVLTSSEFATKEPRNKRQKSYGYSGVVLSDENVLC